MKSQADTQTSRFTDLQEWLLPSSPFLLNATIRHHLTCTDIPKDFADGVLKSLYVDDYLGRDDSNESVFKMYKNLKSSFKNGGFNMRKWVSNSAVLQARIEESEGQSPQASPIRDNSEGKSERQSPEVQVSQVPSKSVENPMIQVEDKTVSSSLFKSVKNATTAKLKVLGVGWDCQKDLLFLDLASPLETINYSPVTQTAVLGATSKLYDPLGLLSPDIILLKIIFQAICKSKLEWDDPVDSFLHEQWLKLVQDIKKVGVLEAKRHYFHGSTSEDLQRVQLHGFADASEKAYGAVVYLRVELTSGTVFTQLVPSKTRVAPINGDTIPRLICTILTAFEGTLNIDSAFCWLNSQIALWWIWGVNKEFKQFVQNRVVEICGLVKPTQWDYCPTEFNPADICSRGSTASKLVANQMWWNGPEFLLKSSEFWPSLQGNSVEITSSDLHPSLELKKETPSSCKKQQDSTVLMNIVAERPSTARLNLECIMSFERFSSLQRLIRVTAYILRFVSNLKRKKARKDLLSAEIKQEEVQQAKELWYKEVQRSVLKDRKFNQVKLSLSLFPDKKGIWRCGGRLKNAPISFDAHFLIFLPRCSRFTHLVINDCHCKVLHNGVRDTLMELRSEFWVTKGRQAVKNAIAKCSVCKKI